MARLLPAAGERLTVELADGRRFRIDAELVITLRLEKGRALDDAAMTELVLSDGISRAMMKANRLIAVRERSSRELRRAMAGIPEEAVQEALTRLTRAGLLDDERFARRWAEERSRSKGLGRQRLRRELREKGIDGESMEEALAGLPDEREAAVAFLRSRKARGASVSDPASRNRLFNQLLRRGFSHGTASEALREVFGSDAWDC